MPTRANLPVAICLLLAVLLSSYLPRAAQASGHRASGSQSPFAGFGAWIELFDTASFAAPEAAVASLRCSGVHTLYLETGNSHQSSAIFQPQIAKRFITAAHANGLKIVAWYLPYLAQPKRDLERARAAVELQTSAGERFDAFALDIESDAVKPVSKRNRRLLALARGLRQAAGPSYPLAAIIPSPQGMIWKSDYWPQFPYRGLYQLFDAFAPMDYFTYRQSTSSSSDDVYRYTTDNIAIVRRETGDQRVPIHVIGGMSSHTDAQMLQGFARGIRESDVIGGSLYNVRGSRPEHWLALSTLFSTAVERRSLNTACRADTPQSAPSVTS